MSLFYKLLSYPKDSLPDKRIRKMSYLVFLYNLYFSKNGEKGIPELDNDIISFFSYILDSDDIKIFHQEKNPEIPISLDNLKITITKDDNCVITEEDFENIREIILEQNGISIEYIEEFASDLEESLLWMQRENPLTFGYQVLTIAALMDKSPSEIFDWTWYQLQDIFDRKIVDKNYNLYEPLIRTGKIEMKSGKLQSYLYHRKKRGRYDSIFMSQDEFSKIESGLGAK
jgi:hypothetical protein